MIFNPEIYCISRRQMLLGQTTKQPLSNFRHQKTWKLVPKLFIIDACRGSGYASDFIHNYIRLPIFSVIPYCLNINTNTFKTK